MAANDDDLQRLVCCQCAVAFAMTVTLFRLRRRDSAAFWCPNGHAQHFTVTEEDALAQAKKENTDVQKERDFWEKEAQRRLEECDTLRGELGAAGRKGGFFTRW